ncbi:hypothetical protein DY000_02036334 [Brassica cretica]|uniref:Uncharacterized protein n=1 Tax=Brassica cretica TaxID=69181 RepID=A0ABQ7BJZ3_BRACR|nr:hypothetical protein DY000_02036334 [Brassica cretica]
MFTKTASEIMAIIEGIGKEMGMKRRRRAPLASTSVGSPVRFLPFSGFGVIRPALPPASHPTDGGRLAFDSGVLAFFSGDGRSAYLRVTLSLGEDGSFIYLDSGCNQFSQAFPFGGKL